jgi:hypothetical protein
MALTKQSFGILVTTMTQWWSPTVVRISGDDGVSGQIKQKGDGRVEFSFPDRLVMIANHQVGWQISATFPTAYQIYSFTLTGCISGG